MFKILKAEQLADKIFLMDVEAPRVAKSCEPGEFVIVKMEMCIRDRCGLARMGYRSVYHVYFLLYQAFHEVLQCSEII